MGLNVGELLASASSARNGINRNCQSDAELDIAPAMLMMITVLALPETAYR